MCLLRISGLFVLFTLFSVLEAKAQKYMTDYDLVKTRNGLQLVGELQKEMNGKLLMARPSGDTIEIHQSNVRNALYSGENILIRSDQKYLFLNHISIGVNYSYLSFARNWSFRLGAQFAKNWYLGISLNSQKERTDFWAYSFPSLQFRKYFNWGNTRPFIEASYGQYESSPNNFTWFFNEPFEVQTGSVELGMQFYSHRNMKLQFSSGVNLRNRNSFQAITDANGNLVELRNNSLVIAYFVQFGLSFNLYSF